MIYHWKSKPLHAQEYFDPKMTLNFYPEAEALAKAFASILIDYTWKHYTIVYENEEHLVRLKDILQIHKPKSENPISLMRLDDVIHMNLKFGSLLKKVPSKNIVLDVTTEQIIEFLTQAREVGKLLDYNKYFITNLDTATINFGSLMDTLPNSNLTSVRLINTTNNAMRNVISGLNMFGYDIEPKELPLEAALVHDAVHFFYEALMDFAPNPQDVQTPSKSCKNLNSGSNYGFTFLEFMRLRELPDGASGHVEFNKAKTGSKTEPRRGSRTEFQLEILEMSPEGFGEIARWNSSNGVFYSRDESDTEEKIVKSISSKTFKIAIRVEEPFIVLRKPKDDTEFLEGNDRFEGYCVELIQRIQKQLGYKYELELVADGKNGNFDKEKNEWNGLIGEIIKGKADLAIADLTITYDRKKVVDFTTPFMNLGIGILFTKPVPKEKNLFSFLDPFTTAVWIYTGLAYIFISILVFILSRINNDDWESSHPCNQDPEEVESIWNILNCVWLMMGSIMGQGSDILPK
jgi:ionotropic glutamate receptor